MNTGAYLMMRLAVGLSMLGHGLVRLPKLEAFSHWMRDLFHKSLLPDMLVLPFSYALPVIEFITGVLLVAGLWTRTAITVAAIALLSLIIGTTMIENWEALPSQLIHILFLAALLQFRESNTYSIDHFIRIKNA